MLVDGKNTRSISYNEDKTVSIIDQTVLPHRLEFKLLQSLNDCIYAISEMMVRGAPLIGITASYGMSFAVKQDPSDTHIYESYKKLIETRPTAVDLKWALENFVNRIMSISPIDRFEYSWEMTNNLLLDSVNQCSDIGEYGLSLIKNIKKDKVNILTHCNAGWLACVDWGTALAPIYKAHNNGINVHVWVDETRPRSQGASLTSWELSKHGIPNTLIVDNAGGHLMQKGDVDLCLVGSDRTASNGDVCNKIGTYMKALCAYDNKIPFYVALPESTIDFKLKYGVNNINIEERSKTEVSHIKGLDDKGDFCSINIVNKGINICNPGFDVTPNKYVSKLITNKGICDATSKGIKSLFK